MIRIKKYGNRRLYDTEQSRYVNLDDLVVLIRDGQEIQVVDAKTQADLTREVLMQVLMEIQGGSSLLPLGLLHRLIRYSGDSTGLALRQLGAGLELLDSQIAQVERQFGWMAQPARARASGAGRSARAAASDADEPPPEVDPEPPPESAPPPPVKPPPPAPPGPAEAARPAAPPEDGLDALRARLAALEGRLKR